MSTVQQRCDRRCKSRRESEQQPMIRASKLSMAVFQVYNAYNHNMALTMLCHM